jgi:hypothetical protein
MFDHLVCIEPPIHWSKKYYQIENALLHQYPAEVAPAHPGYSNLTLFFKLSPTDDAGASPLEQASAKP